MRSRPHADAQVTAAPGVILGVLTADCGPICLPTPKNRVIGAPMQAGKARSAASW